MASLVWAKNPDPDDVWGRHRVTFWTLTLSATAYTTGGFAVSGATFGIKSILGMELIAGTPPSTTSTYVPFYNSATGKLQIFGTGTADQAALDEIGTGTITLVWLFRITSVSD